MDGKSFRNLVEAYSEVYQELDEAEGSYGRTPKARKGYGDLANKRRETPASEYSKRGEKKEKVDSAQKHFDRTGNPDAGNRGKKSTKPSFHSGARKGMTQSDRDYARGEAEYGHTGYDPDFDGGPSAPGSKPKGKKLERQKKTGVSAESYDLFDCMLEYLVAEGYAETNKAAIAIMANMSEEWRESIIEGMDPSATDAAKKQATKTAVDFFTKPKKPLPPYEAKKPRFGALTTPDFDLGTKKSKAPAAPAPAKPKAKPTETEKPKAKPAATPAPAPAKPKATPAPAPTPVKKPPTPTASPKPTEPPKAETPKPSGGEVAGSKIGDKSDYSVAATAKMSDRTKTILGTKDSETGKTIRKAQFGSLSPRERQGLG